jgi:hypothetical protein
MTIHPTHPAETADVAFPKELIGSPISRTGFHSARREILAEPTLVSMTAQR